MEYTPEEAHIPYGKQANTRSSMNMLSSSPLKNDEKNWKF